MKKNSVKKIIAAVLALAMVFCLCACGSKTESKLDKIKKAGKLVMATDACWAPFEYIGANGEPTGSDVELAAYIAEQLGVKLEIINVAFDTLPTYIVNGEADIVLAAMTITEERKESMAFSDPYTKAEQYIVVVDGDDSVATVEDLAGKAIGVHLGTTGDLLVSDEVDGGCLKDTGASVKQYKSLPDASLALLNGELQAIVCDTLMAKNLCTANDEKIVCFPLVYADGTKTDEEYGIGMIKGDDAFTAKINEIIAPVVADGTVDGWIVEHTELASNID